MVLVVGETPEEIRVTRDQYLGLLSQLDAATHSHFPAQQELAYDIINVVRGWFKQGTLTRQVDGQLELPLEWAGDRAGR